MKGDFSREAFERAGRYAGVLAQQGRVQLDSDWNEQVALALHAARAALGDLIGWHGTARPGSDTGGENGFEISLAGTEIMIGPGRYYVDGIPCENARTVSLSDQPFAPKARPTAGDDLLVYLDVWDRSVTYLDDPSLREPALGGPDTSVRLQTVWQVKTVRGANLPGNAVTRAALLRSLSEAGAGVRFATDEPGLAPTGTGYTGLENRLYRVEIHDGGDGSRATFKWSRSNGSVAVRVVRCEEGAAVVQSESTEDPVIAVGDRVELETRATLLAGRPGRMSEVVSVDGARIVPADPVHCDEGDVPILRRWDGPARPVTPGVQHELEDGLRVSFTEGRFKTGDYWQFAARTGVGVIDWPAGEWRGPFGPDHHYAPLALVRMGRVVRDLRRTFTPLGG